MIAAELLVIVALSLLLAVILAQGLRRRGPGPFAGLVFFFALFVLVSWAGLAWVRPVGPLLWGVAWLPIVGLGLFLFLLIAALVPGAPRDEPQELEVVEQYDPDRPELEERSLPMSTASAVGLSLSFWLLLGLLVAIIAFSYADPPTGHWGMNP